LLYWSHPWRKKHDQYSERVPQPAGAKASGEKEAGDRSAEALRHPKQSTRIELSGNGLDRPRHVQDRRFA